MTAQTVTVAQLRPVVERALEKRRDSSAPCIVVTADPDSAPSLNAIGDEPAKVLGSRSPLEIRAAIHDHSSDGVGLLVVLTDLESGALGDDLLARIVNRRPFTVDVWRTVCHLFGAERPSVALAQRPHLAEELIENRPTDGYTKVVSKVLDVDAAVSEVIRVQLGLAPTDPVDCLLERASVPEATRLLSSASAELLTDVTDTLVVRYGDLAAGVVALVAAGKGAELVPWALAGGAIHHPEASAAEGPRAVLDRETGRLALTSDTWRRLGMAAEDSLRDSLDDDLRSRWRFAAQAVLADLGAENLARWSDVIPTGFDQRLDDAASALADWQAKPTESDLEAATQQSINALKQHLDRASRSDQIAVCEMAARMIRRQGLSVIGVGTLADVAAAYRDDGSWLDLARTVVSRGSTNATLDALCRQLTTDALQQRYEQMAQLGQMLAKAASTLPAELVGVEDVLDRVIAPLAGSRRVLICVLDGMGLPTFNEFAAELTSANWTPITTGDRLLPAVAALPTVTEVSRTSLLAGIVRSGDGESERRAFTSHAALVQASRAGKPPLLFHKRDLRVGGLDSIPAEALDAISDQNQQVVGVVINNIDERLKDVVAPATGWNLADLNPLRDLLGEARRSGRAVVLTADHGHILDRDAEQRSTGGGGGERWRPTTGDTPAIDEITVTGPRVGAGDGSIVLPLAEQVRYSTRRNGYHGGLTVQELFVPLVVLVTDDLEGWQPVQLNPPSWWSHQSTAAPMRVEVSRPTPRPAPSATPTLFDPVDEAPSDNQWPDLVQRLLDSDVFADQLANPRVRIDAAQIGPVVARLAHGTPVNEVELSALTGVAVARVGRFVTQMQELLNVDSYPVIRADGGEVRLDVALMTRQFEL